MSNLDFRIQPNPEPWACLLCSSPTDSWSVKTYSAGVPVDSICGGCALQIVGAVLTSPATGLTVDQRRHMAQDIKASITREAVEAAARGAN